MAPPNPATSKSTSHVRPIQSCKPTAPNPSSASPRLRVSAVLDLPPTSRASHHIPRHARPARRHHLHHRSASRAELPLLLARLAALVLRLTRRAQPRLRQKRKSLRRNRLPAHLARSGLSPSLVVVPRSIARRKPHELAIRTRQLRRRRDVQGPNHVRRRIGSRLQQPRRAKLAYHSRNRIVLHKPASAAANLHSQRP
jgi:hypothetical protein